MIIKSRTMQIRRTRVEEIDYVINTEQDIENIKYIIPWSREKHLEEINSKDKLHLIIESNNLKSVGFIIIAGLENKHNSIELVRLVISEKNQGYGKESLKLILDYVFEQLKAHRIWLDVKEHNIRARNLYEEVGFKLEGRLRECLKVGNDYESLLIMGILEEEYENKSC